MYFCTQILKLYDMKRIALFVLAVVLLAGCGHGKKQAQLIDAANFNKEVDGKPVSLYTLQNAQLTMQVTNYGGRVVALWAPDRKGNAGNVVFGYDHIDQYLNDTCDQYLGAVLGRCANRLAGGTITLDDVEYQLTKNEGENTLNGGAQGTDRTVWDVVSANDTTIVMHTVMPDGQDGFPGNLDITMTYTLTSDNALRVDYSATTDKTTLCNLTHHQVFNLLGEGHPVLDHELEIKGGWILPVDASMIPTGYFNAVKGTPNDFNKPHAIGQSLNNLWIVTSNLSGNPVHCAMLSETTTGRQMEVLSNQMGLQVITTANGIILEPQKFPDAIHQELFSDKAILRQGDTYNNICIYKFSTFKK